VGCHRRLGPHETRMLFVEADVVLARGQRREPTGHLGPVEELVGEVPRSRAQQAAGDGAAALWPDHQTTGLGEQIFTGRDLELPPEFISAQQQGHVRRALEVRLADDTALAVARTAVVGSPETLDAKDSEAPCRQLGGRRAAHAPKTHDDHVMGAGHLRGPPNCGRWRRACHVMPAPGCPGGQSMVRSRRGLRAVPRSTRSQWAPRGERGPRA
jgi:hypothetical protein